MSQKHASLLYKDLSCNVRGAAFEARKNYGEGHEEVIFNRAFAEELDLRGIGFLINFNSGGVDTKRVIYTNDKKKHIELEEKNGD
ncbi:MAG: hypothetical protein JSW66_11925 [Phycisphaerales bacterium]|nr:MAG: hypothetical protein JSW66_11925 [Phycisphaerales bacterium]